MELVSWLYVRFSKKKKIKKLRLNQVRYYFQTNVPKRTELLTYRFSIKLDFLKSDQYTLFFVLISF
jgi:hypothetical protein